MSVELELNSLSAGVRSRILSLLQGVNLPRTLAASQVSPVAQSLAAANVGQLCRVGPFALEGRDQAYDWWIAESLNPSVWRRTDAVSSSDLSATYATLASLSLKAPVESPVFTGEPTAPTPTTGDNTLRLATTAFVKDAIAAAPGTPGESGVVNSVAVTTGAAGTSATVELAGTPLSRTLNFTIPRGDPGAQGIPGPGGTITDVTVSTGSVGTAASVVLGGTESARTIALTIPRGDPGPEGPPGIPGADYVSTPAILEYSDSPTAAILANMPDALTFAGADPNVPQNLLITGLLSPVIYDPPLVLPRVAGVNGYPRWADSEMYIEHFGSVWRMSGVTPTLYRYEKTSSNFTPIGLTGWTQFAGNGEPIIVGDAPVGTYVGQLCVTPDAWWRWDGVAWIKDAGMVEIKTSDFTAAVGGRYYVDTGGFTITDPPGSAPGDSYEVIIVGTSSVIIGGLSYNPGSGEMRILRRYAGYGVWSNASHIFQNWRDGSLVMADMENGLLYSGGSLVAYPNDPKVSVDWVHRKLMHESGTFATVDWGITRLSDTYGSSSVNWHARKLLDNTGNFATVDWGDTQTLSDSSNGVSVDWTNRQLISAGDVTVLDWSGDTLSGDGSGLTNVHAVKLSDTQAAPLSTDLGTPGDMIFTEDYIYRCFASGDWRRVAVSYNSY